MDLLATVVSSVFLFLGAILMISAGVGVLRFPDFFTRMHASGVSETLATSMILIALMILAGWNIILFKLILILLFVLITSPTAGHALAKSALHGKLKPLLNKDSSE